MSDETKQEAQHRLSIGLEAVSRLAHFSPYILGPAFTVADCVAFLHFGMIEETSQKIFGESMIARQLPEAAKFMALMAARPHVRTVMSDRAAALEAFLGSGVMYDG